MLRVLAIVIALAPGTAAAQGLGGFVSPGDLAESHADLDRLTKCTSCHDQGVSAARCMKCHDEIAAEVSAGQGFHATLGERCERCHPDHRGRDFDMVRMDEASFDHDTTGFVLRGPHVDAGCTDCHSGDGWRGLDPTCRECHDDPHGADASTRGLLRRCGECHDVVADWKALPLPVAVFDHTDRAHTDYVLEGAHRDVSCDACHADLRFVPTAAGACTDCHEDPHRGRNGPQCTSCHRSMNDWRASGFDHAKTDFPLEGQHRQVSCKRCHGSDTSRPVAHDTCATCHDDAHDGQFAPRACDDCHSVVHAGFAIPDFDHAVTAFPLHGAHTDVACASCHGESPGATYVDVAFGSCADCHEDPHEARFEPTPCATCHTEAGWLVEDFDHDRTDFPLTGAHADVACETCHGDELGPLPFGTCLECHADDDPHKTLDPGSCRDCHDTTDWLVVTFDHTTTGFAISEAHAALTCGDCHQTTDFTGQQPTCEACHEPPPRHYRGACSECHGDVWVPAGFGSLGHAVTGFALHGAHSALDCEACHAPGVARGAAASECSACHAPDDPHRNLLGDRCDDCHTDLSWYRTTWRHHESGWPLRGMHRLATCDDCHATGYAGTPRDCWRCHQRDADPGVPAHQVGDASDCGQCHNPYTWTATGFPH